MLLLLLLLLLLQYNNNNNNNKSRALRWHEIDKFSSVKSLETRWSDCIEWWAASERWRGDKRVDMQLTKRWRKGVNRGDNSTNSTIVFLWLRKTLIQQATVASSDKWQHPSQWCWQRVNYAQQSCFGGASFFDTNNNKSLVANDIFVPEYVPTVRLLKHLAGVAFLIIWSRRAYCYQISYVSMGGRCQHTRRCRFYKVGCISIPVLQYTNEVMPFHS